MQGGEDPVKEPNTEKDLKCVNGTLELKGTYQVHNNYVYEEKYKLHLLSGCHRVIAEDVNLELFAPLVFNSTSLEFEGHLTVVAKAPMAGSCLRVLGQVVISGDFFVKDCQNQLPDTDEYAHGGGINALNIILQKSGQINIENCSSKIRGGAIYVEDSFTQAGGEMMIQHCQAGGSGGAIYSNNYFRQDGGHLTIQNCIAVSSDGGAIYVEDSFIQEGGSMMIQHCQAGDDGGGAFARKNFTQNNGAVQVEDCSAGGDHGGALFAASFRQTGGNISLSNCRADNGGGLEAEDFEQLGGAMRIESCKAEHAGGGLGAGGSVFRQDGELHVRACSAQHGAALYLSSDKVEQGKSATALVEARQLEVKCFSQIGGATHTHTQLATHKHTQLQCIYKRAAHWPPQAMITFKRPSRFYKFAAATQTNCWTFIPAHTH